VERSTLGFALDAVVSAEALRTLAADQLQVPRATRPTLVSLLHRRKGSSAACAIAFHAREQPQRRREGGGVSLPL